MRRLLVLTILIGGMVVFVVLLVAASGPEFESQVTPTLFPTPVLVPPAAIMFQVQKWGNVDTSSIPTPTLLTTPTVLPPQAYLPLVQRNYVYVSPTPTPIPPPTPTPTPTPIPPHPGKGVGGQAPECAWFEMVGAKWFYGWGPNPRTDCEGIEAVPMIKYASQVGITVTGNSTEVLFFNEPSRWDQANITPSLAADVWITVELVYAGYDLVSPAVVNEPWGDGLAWLVEWYEDFENENGRPPTMYAIAVHFYPVGYGDSAIADGIAFLSQAVALADEWGVKLEVTEFAQLPCKPGGMAEAVRFMKEICDWIATQPTITRYAWFHISLPPWPPWDWGPCDPSLVDWETGELTPLGVEYALH